MQLGEYDQGRGGERDSQAGRGDTQHSRPDILLLLEVVDEFCATVTVCRAVNANELDSLNEAYDNRLVNARTRFANATQIESITI